MKRYIIFSKKEERIELGALTWSNGAASTNIDQYYSDDDYVTKERNTDLISKSKDLTTLNLKAGEKIYYDKYVRQDKDATTRKNLLATIGATAISKTRVTATAQVGEEAENTRLRDGYVKGYVIKQEAVVYSYPVHTYVGAKSKDPNTISLYFERTAGIIDEVILNIKTNNSISAIDVLQYEFRNEKSTKDIRINENTFNKYSSKIIGVSEIISSISI